MDLGVLYKILRETTAQYRKGPEVENRTVGGVVKVVDIWMMPHIDDAPEKLEKIDMEFVVVGVDKEAAERYRDDLIAWLKTYPEPDRLAAGPSYIEVGAVLGSQEAAFMLFALGKALNLWDVITPKLFGLEGEAAREAAGRGLIMISGWRPKKCRLTLQTSPNLKFL